MSSLLFNAPQSAPQSASGGATLPRRGGVVQRIATLFAACATRRATRQALARLDSHLLRDCGLDPQHVRQEIAKPFWIG
ncbi:MAG: DUF1127 domain-containing protein [Defluviimonas sp.]|nr:DUF1127 domain-containing protein [Defluviimonas sp.]